MSVLTNPTSVFVFTSVLYRKDLITIEQIKNIWTQKFGLSTFYRNEYCPMKNYYSSEMGETSLLDRFFLVSEMICDRGVLVHGKKWAIEIENLFLKNGNRQINMDIGVLSLENIQLATGKNFTHRIYLQENIYSDLTLIFQGDTYSILPWTYADYGSKEIIDFFNHQRRLLQITLEK